MLRGKNGAVAILDLGTSKVACLLAYADHYDALRIAGIGHQFSEGIRGGTIVDVRQAETSVLAAVHAAEKMAGETIEQVIVNISGPTLRSHIVSVDTAISGHEVTDRDINRVIQQGHESFKEEDAEIIHCIPVTYTIDGTRGVRDPRSMFGNRLTTELHVVTASSTLLRNLASCLARCHLNIVDFVAAPYASGLACLTEDEKNLGVMLLDIGAGTTSVALFAEGNVIYSGSMPLGGMHVTRDIARGLSTSIAYAERIKTIYGSVVSTAADEYEMINISLADLSPDALSENLPEAEDSYISKALLTSIIQPRMEEIFEMVQSTLDSSGFAGLCGQRVVLTGGGSQLQGLRELAGHIFRKHVRIGRPIAVEGLAESTKGPAFSCAVGMLLYAAEKRKLTAGSLKESEILAQKGAIGKVVRWFQENF